MTSDIKAINEQITAILAKELRYERSLISTDTKISALNLDSLAFAECIISIEKECKKRIDVIGLSEMLDNDPSVYEFSEALANRLQ